VVNVHVIGTASVRVADLGLLGGQRGSGDQAGQTDGGECGSDWHGFSDLGPGREITAEVKA
jgi:hypothetical protein